MGKDTRYYKIGRNTIRNFKAGLVPMVQMFGSCTCQEIVSARSQLGGGTRSNTEDETQSGPGRPVSRDRTVERDGRDTVRHSDYRTVLTQLFRVTTTQHSQSDLGINVSSPSSCHLTVVTCHRKCHSGSSPRTLVTKVKNC